MTDERFNELLNGPLSRSFGGFPFTGLALALKAVVDATGEQGELALEQHCAARTAQDLHADDESDL